MQGRTHGNMELNKRIILLKESKGILIVMDYVMHKENLQTYTIE